MDAAAVFAPQKGATQAQVELLSGRLARSGRALRDEYGVDVTDLEFSGAAGGLAGGLAVLGGHLAPRFDLVADTPSSTPASHGRRGHHRRGLPRRAELRRQGGRWRVELARRAGPPAVVIVGDSDPDVARALGTASASCRSSPDTANAAPSPNRAGASGPPRSTRCGSSAGRVMIAGGGTIVVPVVAPRRWRGRRSFASRVRAEHDEHGRRLNSATFGRPGRRHLRGLHTADRWRSIGRQPARLVAGDVVHDRGVQALGRGVARLADALVRPASSAVDIAPAEPPSRWRWPPDRRAGVDAAGRSVGGAAVVATVISPRGWSRSSPGPGAAPDLLPVGRGVIVGDRPQDQEPGNDRDDSDDDAERRPDRS